MSPVSQETPRFLAEAHTSGLATHSSLLPQLESLHSRGALPIISVGQRQGLEPRDGPGRTLITSELTFNSADEIWCTVVR